jgi:hypothetical protein
MRKSSSGLYCRNKAFKGNLAGTVGGWITWILSKTGDRTAHANNQNVLIGGFHEPIIHLTKPLEITKILYTITAWT